MLNLTLLRHAKSDWGSYGGDDFSRDISEIGIKKTEKIGRFLEKKQISFDEILCSPSLRTKKTLKIILDFIKHKPLVRYIDELYYQHNKEIYETIMLEAKGKKVLVISHEPILSASIEDFSSDFKNNDFIRASEKFATSSIFQITFLCDSWLEISKSNSRIVFFKRPSDLKD
tara:strand:+ start:541 stop:1056 length:516 start_codon:yes stop_codon:yes gene_type:complete